MIIQHNGFSALVLKFSLKWTVKSQSAGKNCFCETQIICISCDAVFFSEVCNLHKHSILFFLRSVGPFVQYSLRPTEKQVCRGT